MKTKYLFLLIIQCHWESLGEFTQTVRQRTLGFLPICGCGGVNSDCLLLLLLGLLKATWSLKEHLVR